MDIDAVTLLGSEFDDNGKYILWSPLGDISNIENLEASQELPFPTGKETEVKINLYKDSFFTTHDDLIRTLFTTETDEGRPVLNKRGFPVLKLKELNPHLIKLLGQFIKDVSVTGLSIKGGIKSDGSWKSTPEFKEEWENIITLNDGRQVERQNGLKSLGFVTPEAAFDALALIKKLIDSHNLYINNTSPKIRLKMTKNQCQWAIYLICSSPSNLTELMVSVDVATDPIKNDKTGAVITSPYNGDDKKTAPGNEYSKHRSYQEGQIGKQCVGIGAVSIKVNSTTQYYADSVLRYGTEREKERLLLPKVDAWGNRDMFGKNYYVIDGKKCKGLFNLYDKNAESKGENFTVTLDDGAEVDFFSSLDNPYLRELMYSIQTEDDITPNVALSLAAMLSVAVDNAKDLALAKINAGPKMFGFYAYGISMGFDIRELANIINTPQGRAISKLCEGNILNGQMGTFSALQAIEKLEGKNLYNDLSQFNVVPVSTTHDEYNRASKTTMGILLGKESKRTTYDVVETLMKEYYRAFIKNNKSAATLLSANPFTRVKDRDNINYKETLPNMLYQISVLGRIDDCLRYMMSPSNPLYNQLTEGLATLDNIEDFRASIFLLQEFCKKYGDLVNTYYKQDGEHYYARDLKILAQGAEEMRVLGSILSSNKGIKTRMEDGINFIKTVENAVMDRREIMGLEYDEDYKIDFILFCTDLKYREEAIEKYEKVKHSVNILDVISKAPHFTSYLRAYGIPYASYKVGSTKFRARDMYYDSLINRLEIIKAKDKEGVGRGIENAVNYRMFQEYLAKELMQFVLPKNSTYYTEDTHEVKIADEDKIIPLFDKDGNGLATFKNYMETVVIPDLMQDPTYKDNAFIRGLVPFELTKTSSHAAVTAYTLRGDLSGRTEEDDLRLLNYKIDFNHLYGISMYGSKDVNIPTIPSMADAFYIYSQYVFGGRKGQRSLMPLFDDDQCSISKGFREYVSYLDANVSYDDFTLEELIPWCAPEGNVYNPASAFFYASDDNYFEKIMYEKKKNEKQDPNAENDELYEKSKNKKSKKLGSVVKYSIKNDFLNPALTYGPGGDNIYKIGLNITAVEPETNEIALTDIPEDVCSVVLNPDSGEYSLVARNVLSGRALLILEHVNKNIKLAYTNTYDINTHSYRRDLDYTSLRSLIEESINTIDENC